MFVIVSCIFGEQKKGSACIKKKKTNNIQHKQKKNKH